MALLSALPIVGQLIELGQGYLEGRQKKQQAYANAEAEVIRKSAVDVATWETTMARASMNSWKDEYLTIVFSVPAIMEYWHNGMEGLSTMPVWYQGLLGVMFAASFGVRKATKLFSARKA